MRKKLRARKEEAFHGREEADQILDFTCVFARCGVRLRRRCLVLVALVSPSGLSAQASAEDGASGRTASLVKRGDECHVRAAGRRPIDGERNHAHSSMPPLEFMSLRPRRTQWGDKNLQRPGQLSKTVCIPTTKLHELTLCPRNLMAANDVRNLFQRNRLFVTPKPLLLQKRSRS